MRRRSFLSGSLLTMAGLSTAPLSGRGQDPAVPLVGSSPLLQTPAATSMGVVWEVNRLSTGWVEVATKADFSDAKTFFCGGLKRHQADEKILSARLVGLCPATTYFYRCWTQEISAPNAYKTKKVGAPVSSPLFSFQTLGKDSPSSFAVVNDTHADQSTFAAVMKKMDSLSPAVWVWNGDLFDQFHSEAAIIPPLMRPAGLGYATRRPFLYTPGNHDYRGIESPRLERILLPRLPQERESRFAECSRNFAVRVGDLALIGLDTGEDKPDANPVWAGLAHFEPYRALQTEWLAQALEREEIASAPYLIAFCHIPLFDPRPEANPGDILEGYASWQRPCAQMWNPLFKKAGLTALITAHMHQYRADPPTSDRPWCQIVGGAAIDLQKGRQTTLIHGTVAKGKLTIAVHDLATKSILGSFDFQPRR